jgi:peptidoglycan hydrolase-like protein with peptidoglycan-binding domain
MTHATVPIAAMYQADPEAQAAKHPHATSGPTGGQFVATNTSKSKSAPKRKSAPAKSSPKSAPAPQAQMEPLATAANFPTGSGGASRTSKHNNPAEVRQLQRLLNAMKIGNLAEDGQFGSGTENAVKELQRKLGRPATGHASGALMRQLADAAALSPCVHASAGPTFIAAAAEVHVFEDGTCVQCGY